jgi:hypothetical protein
MLDRQSAARQCCLTGNEATPRVVESVLIARNLTSLLNCFDKFGQSALEQCRQGGSLLEQPGLAGLPSAEKLELVGLTNSGFGHFSEASAVAALGGESHCMPSVSFDVLDFALLVSLDALPMHCEGHAVSENFCHEVYRQRVPEVQLILRLGYDCRSGLMGHLLHLQRKFC